MNVFEALGQVVQNLKDVPAQKRDEHRSALSATFPTVVSFAEGLKHVLKGTAFEHATLDPFWDNLKIVFRFNGDEVRFDPRADGVYYIRPHRRGFEDLLITPQPDESLASAMLGVLVAVVKDSTTKS